MQSEETVQSVTFPAPFHGESLDGEVVLSESQVIRNYVRAEKKFRRLEAACNRAKRDLMFHRVNVTSFFSK